MPQLLSVPAPYGSILTELIRRAVAGLVAVDQEIDKCGARGCVKELGSNRIGEEHISRYRGPCCRRVESSMPNRFVGFAALHRAALDPRSHASPSKACEQF